jgi:predicted nucleotide-binding protein (sugar kinase/HSP70/actin superfamily)
MLTKVKSDSRIIKNLEEVQKLNDLYERAARLVAKSKISATIEKGSLELTKKLIEVSDEEKTRKALTVAREKAMKKTMIAQKKHDEAVKQAFLAHEKYQDAIRAVTKLVIDSRKKSQQITRL